MRRLRTSSYTDYVMTAYFLFSLTLKVTNPTEIPVFHSNTGWSLPPAQEVLQCHGSQLPMAKECPDRTKPHPKPQADFRNLRLVF